MDETMGVNRPDAQGNGTLETLSNEHAEGEAGSPRECSEVVVTFDEPTSYQDLNGSDNQIVERRSRS